MDIDGGNAKQLTNGIAEVPWSFSPDGKWIVYTSLPAVQVSLEDNTLWRIPISGGTSTLITDEPSAEGQVSPDGKLIAFWDHPGFAVGWGPGFTITAKRLTVVPFSGGGAVKTFDFPDIETLYHLRWTRDGSALTYVAYSNGVGNLWSQPLKGGAPKQLTNWRSGVIYSFDWSRDGKQLAVARGQRVSDVVLISNSK